MQLSEILQPDFGKTCTNHPWSLIEYFDHKQILERAFTLYIIYAALEILQPDFCNTYIILEVKVNKYFQRKQRRVKKYWHLFFMFQYMKNMLWNTLPKYIILLQPIVLKETFVPFFNIADKPAFMLLSLRRGRDWKTWLTEIEEEGCIGKIVEELI